MNKEEIKITKEDLVSWLDRPPSNEDLDLCSYLANALEKQQYYLIMKEFKKWLEEIQQEEFDINGFTGVCTEIRIQCVLDKIKELEEGVKE